VEGAGNGNSFFVYPPYRNAIEVCLRQAWPESAEGIAIYVKYNFLRHHPGQRGDDVI
jgi:hypothetical protein